ncbi:MAG: PilZ domain-containing protein [Nitrospirota bacterium]|nr:PilZ domain-containing protein [Nitrospirota bacterium]
MSRRRHKRYTKRIETEFSSGDMHFRGISSDLSEKGLFIRTQHGFVPGTTVNIKLRLPDGSAPHLRGLVKRTVKTHLQFVKNGMGIEILESDSTYIRFVREELIGIPDNTSKPSDVVEVKTNSRSEAEEDQEEAFILQACPACGIKNRVKVAALSMKPRCGKCGSSLT